MSAKEYFTDEAKGAATQAIKDIESHTSVEVVVAVRRRAEDYRHADYMWGVIVMMVALLLILFLPWTFALEVIPLEVAASFVVGMLASTTIAPIRRLLISKKRRKEAVERAARAAFYDLGISKTQGRSGLLVFVSVFEGMVELVPDAGLNLSELGAGWDAKVKAAVEGRQGPRAFASALKELGPLLGKAYPRSADDVNELPDEVNV